MEQTIMKLACNILLVLFISTIIQGFPSRPLNERSTELAWQAWLLVDQNRQNNNDLGLLRKRITPKSVFIAPTFSPDSLPECADGYHSDSMGRCVKIIKIDEAAHLDFLLQKLNQQFGDYVEEIETEVDVKPFSTPGPFQINIPIGTEGTKNTDTTSNDKTSNEGTETRINTDRTENETKDVTNTTGTDDISTKNIENRRDIHRPEDNSNTNGTENRRIIQTIETKIKTDGIENKRNTNFTKNKTGIEISKEVHKTEDEINAVPSENKRYHQTSEDDVENTSNTEHKTNIDNTENKGMEIKSNKAGIENIRNIYTVDEINTEKTENRRQTQVIEDGVTNRRNAEVAEYETSTDSIENTRNTTEDETNTTGTENKKKFYTENSRLDNIEDRTETTEVNSETTTAKMETTEVTETTAVTNTDGTIKYDTTTLDFITSDTSETTATPITMTEESALFFQWPSK